MHTANLSCAIVTVLSVMLLCSSIANANTLTPFGLVAVYTVQGKDPVRVTLKEGDILPGSGAGVSLDRIELVLRKDTYPLYDLKQVFRNIAIAIKDRQQPTLPPVTTSIPLAKSEPGNTFTVWSPRSATGTVFQDLNITLRNKYSRTFLCSQETLLRHSSNKQHTQPTTTLSTLKPFPEVLGNKPAIVSKGGEVLYSFCGDQASETSWDELLVSLADTEAKDTKARQQALFGKNVDSGNELRLLHKNKLVQMLIALDQEGRFGDGSAKIKHKSDRKDLPKNVFAEYNLNIKILSNPSHSFVFQRTSDSKPLSGSPGERSKTNVIDQVDGIELAVPSWAPACANSTQECEELLKWPLEVQLDIVEGPTTEKTDEPSQKTPSKLTLKAEGKPSARSVALNLKEHLDTTLQLTLLYKRNGLDVPLTRVRFDVENLGFIVRVPVASEIAASANKWSAQDSESESLFPVGIALPLEGDDSPRLALIYPFSLSYNFESIPDFAQFLTLQTHLAVLAPVETAAGEQATSEASTTLAFGVGAQILNGFHISWGMTLDDAASQHVFLGLSLGEFVPIIKNMLPN